MSDSYSVKARLSATDSGFSSTLKNAIGLTDSFKSKIASIGTGILQGVGQSLFSGITSGISDMYGELNAASGAWKTFEGNMSMLGKSAGEISKVKNELSQFATESIYSASDMATTYAQLAAVGVGNTTELVKGFGGLAAAAENPTQAMKTLSQQATQMAAKPNVAWADFKLMLEQTPAGLAQVAKAMGMTTSELVQNVQAGTVATDEFFAAIVKAGGTGTELNKLATEYKTIDQAVGGLKETIATKLTPAFNVLSDIGIKAISGIVDSLGKIDGQAIANAVSGWIKKAQPLWNSFSKAVSKLWGVVSGVAKKLAPAFNSLKSTVGDTVKSVLDKIGAIDVDSVVNKIYTAINKAKPYFDAFVSTMASIGRAIAPVIKWLVNFGKAIVTYLLDNSEQLSKAVPYIIGVVGAFKGFSIVKSIVPGVASFAKSITSMAAGGIKTLATKLFGVAAGQKAAGTASATSAPAMAAAAKAFMMTGAGILMTAAGFALLAQSAIALAAAGWPAIAVMGGLVIALAALMIGTLLFINTLSASAAQMTAAGTAMMALGAAVLMIGAGFTLLAMSSIALANAGWGAIAVMIGMVAAIALLAVGAAFLGTALTAGAVGFIAFGAALLMAGIGAVLAATSLVILSTCLPMIVQYGLMGAVSIAALGAALLVFGAGALVAGAGALVLGAGLLVVGTAVAVLAAGFLVLSVGALLTAASLAIMSAILPTLAAYGLQGAVAILALSGALLVFGVAAGVAAIGAVALSVGLIAASAGIMIAAVMTAILAGAMVVVAASAIAAALAFGTIGSAILIINSLAVSAAWALTQMNLPLWLFAPAALAAGAAALVLGAGFAVAAISTAALGVAILILGAGIMAFALGAIVAAGAIALLSLVLPGITAYGTQGAAALAILGAGMLVFAAGAAVAGVACTLLGVGLALMAVSLTIIAVSSLVAAVGITALSTGCIMLAAGMAAVNVGLLLMAVSMPLVAAMTLLVSAAMTALVATSLMLAAALLVVSAGLLALMAGVITAGAGIMLFGTFALVAVAGLLLFAAALKSVNSSMKSIAKNAKNAEKSVTNMRKSVGIVEAGLKALGDTAKNAMEALVKAFKKPAADVLPLAQKIGVSFTVGLHVGLITAPAVALKAANAVVTALQSGGSAAYSAGAFISMGFANGMLSCLSVVRSAAAKLAAEADKAVRAKAKIHSPSKVATKLGNYWGGGYAGGLSDMANKVWDAAQELVTIPNIATPNLAMAYSGELGTDYSYTNSAEYLIEVSLPIDGKEFARVTVPYTQAELNRQQTRTSRKHGEV